MATPAPKHSNLSPHPAAHPASPAHPLHSKHPHHHPAKSKPLEVVGINSPLEGRDVIPPVFLEELVRWGATAPNDVFTQGTRPMDVCNDVQVFRQLGPYGDMTNRRAVMLEILRVLGWRESKWT